MAKEEMSSPGPSKESGRGRYPKVLADDSLGIFSAARKGESSFGVCSIMSQSSQAWNVIRTENIVDSRTRNLGSQ